MNTPWSLQRNAFDHLVLVDADGITHEGVVPVRAFPLDAPDEGVSLISSDGHELAWIDRLTELDATRRELIETELARREFMPIVHQIAAVSTFATPSTWSIESNRGRTDFVLRGEEDIRRIDHRKLLITDSHGIQYLIPDLNALNRHSRRLLDRFL